MKNLTTAILAYFIISTVQAASTNNFSANGYYTRIIYPTQTSSGNLNISLLAGQIFKIVYASTPGSISLTLSNKQVGIVNIPTAGDLWAGPLNNISIAGPSSLCISNILGQPTLITFGITASPSSDQTQY
jgi:hypothetical protein